jgi:hypothetical protein
MTILVCVLSLVIGAVGYKTYMSMNAAKESDMPTSANPTGVVAMSQSPSPTPIKLHAGVGDYAVSHAKTGGPTIQRVIFDPLDAKKGQPMKLSAVILTGDTTMEVTGGLTTDSQQVGLTFTKTGNDKNAQIWSTEIVLPDTVLYNYVFSVTAADSHGKTNVRVSPRS